MSREMNLPSRERTCTVRLQLHKGFTFDDAARVVPYLAKLGASHVYTSPVLQAAAGSTHGYDVIDHGRVNEELGGEAARRRFVEALRANRLRWMLDIVPNHMAIGDRRNAWWWDVLENGPSSSYASFFDIDWTPPEPRLKNVVLAPILGDHRGDCLARGEIKIVREVGEVGEACAQSNAFVVRYFDHALPLAPRTHDVILRAASRAPHLDGKVAERLAFLADAYGDLPLASSTDRSQIRRRHRDKGVLRSLLCELLESDQDAARAVDEALATISKDPDVLDTLLERQNYRLAYWRTAERELDYRRFFDINHLVGLRSEDDLVFEESHRLALEWTQAGELDGLRVDHVDGLADPAAYLARLRARAPNAWIVVEKILCDGEELPRDWPIDGTSGYDFLGVVNSVFVDPAGEEPLTALETRFTGETRSFEQLARDKKLAVLRDVLASDVKRVTSMVANMCSERRDMRDYTRHDIHEAIQAVVASLPVYRLYVSGTARDEDRALLDRAIADARVHHPDVDPRVLAFLSDVLTGVVDGADAREVRVRFQQLTGPAMAKGVEDTAFYSAHRLASLCEVGAHPQHFGAGVDNLHVHNARAQQRWPYRLITTSTHDTKRSEDVRARISLLSEVPAEWAAVVDKLSSVTARHRTNGHLPDRAIELLLYQTLVGAWPLHADRLATFAQKAAREAKVHTSWARQDGAYEQALDAFCRGVAGDESVRRILEDFLAPLLPAARATSLATTLLKMTSPGVPDIYQGCDLWDESLVDPDNRRAVDWGRRERALADLERMVGARDPEAILGRIDEGLPKLHVIRQACALRARRPVSFAAGGEGRYEPIRASGRAADNVIAFSRGDDAVVVVPRLLVGLARRGGYQETTLPLPEGKLENVMTGDIVQGGIVKLSTLLARFPVALLERKR